MAAVAHSPIASGVSFAVASALSFGVTTPLIARFGAGVGPLTTAALLYGGAALLALVVRKFSARSGRALAFASFPRLLAVGFFGAALAPTLLVWGLSRAGATGSSLVLNFEAAFTVLFAWAAYREHVGRRVASAVVAMFLGGAMLALDAARSSAFAEFAGLAAVLAATACWAIDNTLTRGLSEEDPFDVVAAKGSLGAALTASAAFAFSESLPEPSAAVPLILCGASGYGVSLRLYLLAQRRIGAVRTSSVFAVGPFVGAGFAWLLGDRGVGWATAFGAVAFGVGVLLHLTERHSHRHVHGSIEHEHAHRHDDGHHEHEHAPPFVGEHTHPHRHQNVEHEHDHAPDIHHEHRHS